MALIAVTVIVGRSVGWTGLAKQQGGREVCKVQCSWHMQDCSEYYRFVRECNNLVGIKQSVCIIYIFLFRTLNCFDISIKFCLSYLPLVKTWRRLLRTQF